MTRVSPIQSGVLPDLGDADRTIYDKKSILEISSITRWKSLKVTC